MRLSDPDPLAQNLAFREPNPQCSSEPREESDSAVSGAIKKSLWKLTLRETLEWALGDKLLYLRRIVLSADLRS